MSEVVKQWSTPTLGEIGLPRTLNVDPSNYPKEIFELYSVPSFSLNKPEIVPGSAIGSTKQLVEPGDVLLCKIVPHLVRVWCVPSRSTHRQIASGEWIVVRPDPAKADKHYLRYALIEPGFRSQFMETVSGVGGSLMRARPKSVAQIRVPLPAKGEQLRIVTKLDGLLGRSKCAREELAHIPRLVERYKQAILAAAFSGELTSDWRRRNPTADMPHVQVGKMDSRVSVLPALPEKWLWTSIASVASVTGGLTKNAQRRSLPTKVRYLRVANVYANELRLDDVGEIGCTTSELERTRLMPGDLLIVEGNGSQEQIGRVAIWNAEVPVCSHQNHLIRARLGPFALPKFALYWILSPGSRSSIEQVASSSSGLYTLSISKVAGLPIPVCSIAEQEIIILRITEAFTRIDGVFAELSRAAELLDRLDQSTLTTAFRGDLVPQDPNEKPISAPITLSRIEGMEPQKVDHPIGTHKTMTTRVSREKSAMTKSRRDEDVSGKPYLAGLLRQASGPTKVEELFMRAELPLTDFYKQLAFEVDAGYIRDDKNQLEAA